MAVTKIRKTSSMVFLISVIATLIVIALFLFGGQVAPEEKIAADMSQPRFTDLMLYWAYILLAVTVLSWALFGIYGFLKNLKDNPKGALGRLMVVIALVAVLGVSYALGSGELLNIPGYDGKDNNPATLKMTDMWIFSMYFLFAVSVVAILISPLLGKRK